MIQFIHISWTSTLSLFFQDSAISYAIFRSLNSCTLCNSLLDYNALKSWVNSSYMIYWDISVSKRSSISEILIRALRNKLPYTKLLLWILFPRKRRLIFNYYTNFNSLKWIMNSSHSKQKFFPYPQDIQQSCWKFSHAYWPTTEDTVSTDRMGVVLCPYSTDGPLLRIKT